MIVLDSSPIADPFRPFATGRSSPAGSPGKPAGPAAAACAAAACAAPAGTAPAVTATGCRSSAVPGPCPLVAPLFVTAAPIAYLLNRNLSSPCRKLSSLPGTIVPELKAQWNNRSHGAAQG